MRTKARKPKKWWNKAKTGLTDEALYSLFSPIRYNGITILGYIEEKATPSSTTSTRCSWWRRPFCCGHRASSSSKSPTASISPTLPRWASSSSARKASHPASIASEDKQVGKKSTEKPQYHHGKTPVPPWKYWSFPIGVLALPHVPTLHEWQQMWDCIMQFLLSQNNVCIRIIPWDNACELRKKS